ncbi:MAG: hypothetical protein K6T75_02935 [Acetobacteraceae bacterium]|nr:hypothetical protein [Acetobacteraceae bacterium]
MSDVLLVDPGARFLEKEAPSPKPYPHIGLAYLAASLRAQGLEVEVLDEVFEKLYQEADPGFLALVDAYSSERDDEDLRRLVLRLYAFSRSHVDPDGWLDQAAMSFEIPPGERLEETVFAPRAVEDIALSLEEAANRLRQAEHAATRPLGPVAYAPALADDIARVSASARAVREQARGVGGGRQGRADAHLAAALQRPAVEVGEQPVGGDDQRGDLGGGRTRDDHTPP